MELSSSRKGEHGHALRPKSRGLASEELERKKKEIQDLLRSIGKEVLSKE